MLITPVQAHKRGIPQQSTASPLLAPLQLQTKQLTLQPTTRDSLSSSTTRGLLLSSAATAASNNDVLQLARMDAMSLSSERAPSVNLQALPPQPLPNSHHVSKLPPVLAREDTPNSTESTRPQCEFVYDTSSLDSQTAANSNSNSNNSSSRSSSTSAPKVRAVPLKPKGMQRAKAWNIEVENIFRFQAAGFRDRQEYIEQYDEPECWPEGDFIKCLQHKTTGFFMIFRKTRECDDKYLPKIKIYSY